MNRGRRIVPIWLRVLLIAVFAYLGIIGLQLTLGSPTWGPFAVGIVLLAVSVYGIRRLLRGWPREAPAEHS